jgi:hypothetical protein
MCRIGNGAFRFADTKCSGIRNNAVLFARLSMRNENGSRHAINTTSPPASNQYHRFADAVAGAGDCGCLRSGCLAEISLPTARQGRSRFDLLKAYTVGGVSVAVFKVKVALVIRDCAFELDVQAVGDTLDYHVLQVSVRDQEGRGLAEEHLHRLIIPAVAIVDVEPQVFGLIWIPGILNDVDRLPRNEVLLQDYLGRKFRFLQVRIDENACKAEQKDNQEILFNPDYKSLQFGLVHGIQL